MLLTALVCTLPLHSAATGGGSAPSSHLVYSDASFEGDLLINEVRVPASGEAMYTYYEGLGWSGRAAGYAGIQSHPKGHNFLFSIWDHEDHAGPIQPVHCGPGTTTETFGGEGTGLKSWNFELGWETDVWYTLVARSWSVGDHTHYGYWVRSGKTGEWTHLVTMDVAAKDAHLLGGNDSFLEDWLETGSVKRTSHLRRGWKRKLDRAWHAFASARYSVNSWDLVEGKRSFDCRTSWDGGVARDETGEFYYMTSGGADTRPTTENPSTFGIARTEERPSFPIVAVEAATRRTSEGGEIQVHWKLDATTAPQFAYTLVARDPDAKVVFDQETTEAHRRSATMQLPEGVNPKDVVVTLSCRDIFDGRSEPMTLQLK